MGQCLVYRITAVSLCLYLNSCLEVFRNCPGCDAAHRFQGLPGYQCIGACINRGVRIVPSHIDLAEEEVLFIGDSRFAEEIVLEHIGIIKALGSLYKTDLVLFILLLLCTFLPGTVFLFFHTGKENIGDCLH